VLQAPPKGIASSSDRFSSGLAVGGRPGGRLGGVIRSFLATKAAALGGHFSHSLGETRYESGAPQALQAIKSISNIYFILQVYEKLIKITQIQLSSSDV
jgi:hypothetical protein